MKSTVKLIILGAAISLTGCGDLVEPLSRARIAKRLQESTVLVRTRHGDNDGHGTAFFVRGKSGVCTLVTAAHVVLDGGREKEVVRLQTGDGREREPLQIMPFDRDLDLAAVTFAPREGGGCPYRPLELGNSETVEELDPIYISGFPGRSGGEPVRQTIPTTVTGLGNLPQGYSISYKGELYGGMSGGPVLDRKGRVIAVHGLSDRRLVELYDAQRQASLLPQELAAVRQAEDRVRSGVFLNTFKWGIPINLYVRYRPAMVVPDGVEISPGFIGLMFGGVGLVALLLVFGKTAGAVLVSSGATGWQYAVRFRGGFLIAGVVAAGAVLVIHFGPTGWYLVKENTQRLLDWMQSSRTANEKVELKSARGVDYGKLRDLLAAQKFREADGETWRVILMAAGMWDGEKWSGSPQTEDIENLPCEDLRIIDRLWAEYSDGRFGFSVQKQIYRELGGTGEFEQKIWEDFGARVGWRTWRWPIGDKTQGWLRYDEYSFEATAEVGHLPSGSGGRLNGRVRVFSLLSRAETCKLRNQWAIWRSVRDFGQDVVKAIGVLIIISALIVLGSFLGIEDK